MEIIAYAIPAFMVCIAVEALVAWRRGVAAYRVEDALSDLACGVGNQVIELGLKLVTLSIYVWVYEYARVWSFEPTSIAMWLLAMVGYDFCYYWWHRSSHVSNVLWAVHSAHHQSEDYNLAVALRQPFLQAITLLPFFLPLAVLGVSPFAYVVTGAVSLLYQFWIHTRLIGSLGPLESVLNTPSHHRVHHAVNPEYLDRNHGAILILWDRLFGTFEREVATPVYGTTTPLASWDPVWGNLQHFGRIRRLVGACTGVRQRLYAFVAHPAWTPNPAQVAVVPADLGRTKYDAVMSPRLRVYVLAQVTLLSSGLFWVLLTREDLAPTSLAAIGAVMFAGVWGCGVLLEQRRWMGGVECARIVISTVTLVWLGGDAWARAPETWAAGLALAGWSVYATRRPPASRDGDQ